MKWTNDDWRARLKTGDWVMAGDRARLRAHLRGRTVYLASASPRRREILRQCGIAHRTTSHTLVEPSPHGPDWRGWTRTWAFRKNQNASATLKSGIVISADTIVVLGSRGLGKPRDREDARRMLHSLSGKVHQVYTGVSVINKKTGQQAIGSAVSHVRFRKLTDWEIDRYVQTKEPLDKAGSYAIQGHASQFIDQIAGPLDNIIGLPIGCLVRLLDRIST